MVQHDPVGFLLRIEPGLATVAFPAEVKARGITAWTDSPFSKHGDNPGPFRRGEKIYNHYILDAYVQMLSESPLTSKQLVDYFARTYYYSQTNSPQYTRAINNLFNSIFPPMYFFESTRSMDIRGHAQSLMYRNDKQYFIELMSTTAEIGALKRFLWNERKPIHCPHTSCPIRRTHLCQEYYNYPDGDYHNCLFPAFLKQSNMDLLLRLCD
jgi:hypothetical protein